MRLTCPACGAAASLDVLVTHEGAREAVAAALQSPAPLSKLIIQYLALHRPEQRQLSMDRVANLLGELLPMIKDGKIERHGKPIKAPYEAWRQALEEITARRDTLRLPLKGHGYLLEIISAIASRESSQPAPTSPPPPSSPPPPPSPDSPHTLSPEERERGKRNMANLLAILSESNREQAENKERQKRNARIVSLRRSIEELELTRPDGWAGMVDRLQERIASLERGEG